MPNELKKGCTPVVDIVLRLVVVVVVIGIVVVVVLVDGYRFILVPHVDVFFFDWRHIFVQETTFRNFSP